MAEQFQFDTSGEVLLTQPGWLCSIAKKWSDLSPFEQGYVVAMAQSPLDTRDPFCKKLPLCYGYGFSDIDPSALAWIREDCARMLAVMRSVMLSDEGTELGRKAWIERQAGNWPDFRPLTVYLNDAGKVCLRDAPSSVGGA